MPTEHAEDGRTDDEDGCHLTHVPHTLDPSPTAAADTEPPRTNGTGVAMGGRSAAVVGTPTITESRKVGGPSTQVRESHPAYGMGDTRPGKPLVTLDQWKALPLDARATLATYPQDAAQDLRDAVAPLRDAVERVVSFYADAVIRSGFDPDAEAFDAVTRSVVLRADRDGAEGAADTLCRLVTWAEANPDKLGKPYKGREAWLSSWVLFGSPEGARGTWQPTTARLTDNINLMRASEKVAAKAERRKSAPASVADPEPAPPPLEGFTAEEEYELMVYRLKRVTQKSVITPELEARLAEYDAAKASKEAVSA